MPLYFPRKWIERYTETVYWKILSMKKQFYALIIEICSSSSKSLIIIGNFWKHSTVMHIKAPFFVFYTVIPGYFNEFIYEIMKWNISRIKCHNYKVLNLQVYLNSFGVNLWKPVILGHFLQKRWLYFKNAIFSTFTLWKWISTKVLNHKYS